MARNDPSGTLPAGIREPQISLMGSVDECMACDLRDKLADPGEGSDPLVIEISTLGGDPDMARRMIFDLDLARKRLEPRRLVFLGKTVVYSAGATFMAGFPCKDRFLTSDAILLLHSRQLKKTLEIEGPLRPTVPMIKALLHQLETGIDLEEKNFARLVEGSNLSLDELKERALFNWYIPAKQALELGLIAGIVEP